MHFCFYFLFFSILFFVSRFCFFFLLFFQLKFPVGLLCNPPETRLCMIRILICCFQSWMTLSWCLVPGIQYPVPCSKIPGTPSLNSSPTPTSIQSNCNYRKHVVGYSNPNLRFVTLLIYVGPFSQRYSNAIHDSALPFYRSGWISGPFEITKCDRRAFYFLYNPRFLVLANLISLVVDKQKPRIRVR